MRWGRARLRIANWTWVLLGLLGVAAVTLAVLGRGGDRPRPVPQGTTGDVMAGGGAPGHVRREIRPTLDPARFVGKAALAHQVARDLPDVLDQLYCYCACDKSIGHKSLLSCYTDGHAAT